MMYESQLFLSLSRITTPKSLKNNNNNKSKRKLFSFLSFFSFLSLKKVLSFRSFSGGSSDRLSARVTNASIKDDDGFGSI